ncbi:MAG: hypothetical protein ABIH86_07195 [Planctomycetota bacterium]
MTSLHYFFLATIATILGVVSVQIRQENYRLKRELATGQRTNERIIYETENAKLVFSGSVVPLELTRKANDARLILSPSEGKNGVWLSSPVRDMTFGPNPNLYPRPSENSASEAVELLVIPDVVMD